jgi:DNA helicase-2/ATP-dependent DNA helicase PcrA
MLHLDDGNLNSEQEAAIRVDGSVFLIACPGSGKTRTLIYKIAYELAKLDSEKKYVVAITYTHRAADEIHERIENLGVDTSQLWIGTIHSFCLEWIIKPYAIYHDSLKHGFRVINSHDSQNILTDLCKPYKSKKITYWDCGYYLKKEGYVLCCDDAAKHADLHSILGEYFGILSTNRQIDFELILYYSYQLIESNRPISLLLSKLFSFILIDEYQDTKEIQYSIVGSILSSGEGGTAAFIVGDPNQAIYHSLGGYAIACKEFEKICGIKFHELELSRNYRSSERIINYFANYKVFDAKIESASESRGYPSLISFDNTIKKDLLEEELIRLIKFNVEIKGIAPQEICILAPQWTHLASTTRKLVTRLPEYNFDGPGMVPFARDIDNFWYKLSKVILTKPSPLMYIRRLRWAGEVLSDLETAGASVASLTRKGFLRECNSVQLTENDGLLYLKEFFANLFAALQIDFRIYPVLQEHYEAFFDSSKSRIERLRKDSEEFIGDINSFTKVFESRSGITLSTIHGVKGTEFDTVIAYGLLEGMVPHYSDTNGDESAKKLLYVISSRARKNLHFISESGRPRGFYGMYEATLALKNYKFNYDIVS